MTAAVLLLFAPLTAEKPGTAHFAAVDFAVVNFVRTYTEERDDWGRPRWTPQCTVWISYYDFLNAPFGWNGCGVPVAVISRGWSTTNGVRSISRCSEGWCIETAEFFVITPTLYVIQSPYDWELRNRRIHAPLKRP